MKLGRSNQFDLLFISNIIQEKDELDHTILSALSTEDILGVADLLLESKALAHAILTLEFAVSNRPVHSEIYAKLIQVLMLSNNLEEAKDLLEYQARSVLTTYDYKMLKAELFIEMNRIGEAEHVLESIPITSNEQACMHLYLKAQCALAVKLDFLAIDLLKQAIKLDTDNQLVQQQLLSLLSKPEELDQNQSFLEEILDKNPFAYQLWFLLGKIQLNKGNKLKALEAFDFASIATHRYLPASEAKLELFLESGQYVLALDELLHIIEHFDPTIDHFLQTAFCFMQLSKIDNAAQILHFAQEYYPDEEEIYFLLAQIEIERKDYLVAIEYVNMALKLNADNEIFHNIAADIYEELGDTYAMKQHLLKSIALDPINHESWVKLILSYLHQEDFEQCNALLEEALLSTYHTQLDLLQAAIWIEMDQRFLAFEILNKIAEEDVKAINPIYSFLPKLINDSDLKTLVQVFQTI